MPGSPILKTKLQPPAPGRDMIARPGLIQRIEGSLDGNLVLISAPAGYGKTSLAAAWRMETDRPTAWLSLDDGENDPARLLRYLRAAIHSVLPERPQQHQKPTELPGWEGLEHGLTRLLNQIADWKTQIILVVDDLQTVRNPPSLKVVEFLLDHQPRQLGILAASRLDPDLPLPSYRGKGQLVEIKTQDLRFSEQETRAFLNKLLPVPLSGEEIRVIHQKTEGWAAGIRLSAAALLQCEDRKTFTAELSGKTQPIAEYLTDEVIQGLPENIRNFLLLTSPLEQLSAPLCSQVTDREDSTELLKTVVDQNLFLEGLDQDGTWFRYQGLFQEVLQDRLQQTRPELVPILHQRAASWFSAQGWFDLAVHHAWLGSDPAGTAALLDRHIDDLWERGEISTALKWARKLGPETLEGRNRLAVYLALALILTGHLEKGISRLQELERTLDADELKTARGWLEAGAAYAAYYQRNIPEVIRRADTALESLPLDSPAWRGGLGIMLANAHLHMGNFEKAGRVLDQAYQDALVAENSFQLLTTWLHQAIRLIYQGQLKQAAAIIENTLADKDIAAIPAAGALYAVWADILREWNRLEEAEDLLAVGTRLSAEGSGIAARAWTALVGVKLAHSQGDPAGMEKGLNQLDKLSAVHRVPEWVVQLQKGWEVRCQLLKGNLTAANRLLADWENRAPGTSPLLALERALAEMRITLARAEEGGEENLSKKLAARAAKLVSEVESRGWLDKQLEIILLQVRASALQGKRELALQALASALDLAEPAGYLGIFLREGVRIRELVRTAAAREDLPRYADTVLKAWGGGQDTEEEYLLSEREREILELIAAGHTNAEIGERLFITTGTVKVHVSHIYQKLGVSSRTRAVRWASELGLLE